MNREFEYGKMDRRAHQMTAIFSMVFIVAVLFLVLPTLGDTYTRAVILSVFCAIVLLCILSIPRKIVVSEETLEIRCVVDLTKIPLRNIASAERLRREDMRTTIPLLGAFGFFGYYGYYLNLRNFKMSVLYCTEWDNFVRITDIYEKQYIVSCPKPAALVYTIRDAIEALPK